MQQKKLLLVTTTLFFLTLLSPASFAWDSVGHRIISAIAYANLTPKAKQKVDALTTLLDAGYPPQIRFGYISTLPDKWRQNNKQLSSQHFINFPWQIDNTPATPAVTPNLITALQTNEAILTSPAATSTQKANALAYVLHLTEDAHQPLHCINQFSIMFPHGDGGGNLFPIRSKYANNLHAYWDQSARFLQSNRRYPFSNKQIFQLAQTIQSDYPKSAFGADPDDFSAVNWTTESYNLAKQKVYGLKPNTKPSAAYKKMQREVAARQMALAGYRLAGWLNQALGGK